MDTKKRGKEKSKKLFSMKWKLLIVFAVLTFIVGYACISTTVKLARKTVMHRVEKELVEKAKDTAKIIDRSIKGEYKYLETIARMKMIRSMDITYLEKAKRLKEEADFSGLKGLYICDANGTLYADNGKTVNVSDRKFYQESMKGISFVTEPYIDRVEGKLVLSITVPIYDSKKTVIGILCADFDGLKLNEFINDIVVGKTGCAYIIDKTGTIIADPDPEFVTEKVNSIELAKTDSNYISVAKFEKHAIDSQKSSFDYFDWKGNLCVASFGKIQSNNWTVIIFAEASEFLNSIKQFRLKAILIGVTIYIIALIIIFLITGRMVKPVKKVSEALKNIAEGDGDLTVRLPLISNDEVTEVSHYFNETIEKINTSIKSVLNNTSDMSQIGQTLSSNMTETASSINQISANIEGVKGQVLSQSTGVTETSATMEEIIRTIHSLDERIANQVQGLQNLITIIHDSDKTTAETRNILDKNDQLIAELVDESSEGKTVINASEQEVKKILEESGSLMEASSIIQNIASQTNLLAMNAAIEAAHAGDAGKGFAVVADEIRKLAEESASQAKVITASLKNLSAEIESVSKSSSNIGESFGSIFDKVNQVKNRSAGIMKIAESRKEQSEQLLSLIENVDNITNEVKDGSAEMLKGGEQVATEMRKLDELTRIITDSMNEMASGAVQINNAVQEVSELTQQNKESIKNLSEEVNKFKV